MSAILCYRSPFPFIPDYTAGGVPCPFEIFNQNVNGVPLGGVSVFERIVPPGTTLVSEEDGKFIFPPGGSWVIFLTSPSSVETTLSAIVALGWWEEKAKRIK